MKVLFLIALLSATSASAETYAVDPARTQVTFSVRGPVATNARGVVTASGGRVVFEPDTPGACSVAVELDMRKLTTGLGAIDAWLRGKGGFDVDAFPTARFASTQVVASGDGQARITGDLTLHGITRPVTILATLGPSGGDAVAFNGEGQVKRSDFGLKNMPFVSDTIVLRIVLKTIAPK